MWNRGGRGTCTQEPLSTPSDRAHTIRITGVLSTAVCGHVFYVNRVGHIWDVWIVRVAVAHTDNSGEEPAPSCECAAVMMNHNS